MKQTVTDRVVGNLCISQNEVINKSNRGKSLEEYMQSFESQLQDISKEFAANITAINNILLKHSNELKEIENQHPDSELMTLRRENLELKNGK